MPNTTATRALGLNRADLLWLANTCIETPKLPTIGYEVAGVVEAVSASVTAYKPGDRATSLARKQALLPARGHQVMASDPYATGFNPVSGRHNFSTVASAGLYHQQDKEVFASLS